MQVKKQCYILAGSVLVPLSVIAVGFNLVSAAMGILYYLCFLVYSLREGELPHPEEDKSEDDIEAMSTPICSCVEEKRCST